jgi:hypothetical protein
MQVTSERYAVIDTENVVVAIVLWDGVTPWSPPDGETVIRVGDQICDRGYTYDPATGLFAPATP